MSCGWFPEPFEIDVDNPGGGEIFVRRQEDDYGEDWEVTLRGGEIGKALQSLTELALDDEARYDGKVAGLPGMVTRTQARKLLPAFQRAVILAAAATDRFERIFVDDECPQRPICTTCGEGSYFTPDKDSTNPWCTEHGHRAFGYDYHLSWDRTLESYERDRSWWESMRALRAPLT